jgi:integrase
MKINPIIKLIRSSNKSPIFIRLRDKFEGKDYQSTISVGKEVEPKYFNNGSISSRAQDFHDINEVINSITTELRLILTELKREGKIPLPNLVKYRYNEKIKQKKFDTPKIKSFWLAYKEWNETKRGLSRGYTKTLITLGNRLKDFEVDREIPISFEYTTTSTQLFQSQFQNFLWDNKKLTNGYINKLLASLGSFLHYSHEMGYITKKPRFKLNGTPKLLEKPFLRSDEVLKLFNSEKFDYTEENWKKIKRNKKYNRHLILINQELLGKNSKNFGGVLTITNWELVRFIHLWCCSVGCRFGDVAHFRVSDFSFDREKKYMEWIQQKTNRRNSVPINDISGFIFRKFSRGKKLEQLLFPPLSIQKFNKHLKLVLEELNFNRTITKPRMRGSIMIDEKPQELHQLISSHSGRHSFITNTIELGTMDYKTIMSLSGHTTTSSFLGYVSVLEGQREKVSKLYQLETSDEKDEEKRLVELYKKINDTDKKFLMGWLEGQSNK